jgi:hypothetical protein
MYALLLSIILFKNAYIDDNKALSCITQKKHLYIYRSVASWYPYKCFIIGCLLLFLSSVLPVFYQWPVSFSSYNSLFVNLFKSSTFVSVLFCPSIIRSIEYITLDYWVYSIYRRIYRVTIYSPYRYATYTIL